MTSVQERHNVTLLHKKMGPTLFQYRSTPFQVDLRPQSSRSSLPSEKGKPAKRFIVKCVDRQDANTMFDKRLREMSSRAPRPPRRSSVKGKRNSKKSPAEETCDLLVREKLFSNGVHKAAGFPPPNFMPKWNPRHKDRTYCEKAIYQDPWSLSSEERADLQKRTGLRLKSLSRHYQFKVGANLPFGRDALENKTCICYVNHCNHCQKSYTERCPLHRQVLDPVEHDCKTELGEFCPIQRNIEDMRLEEIQDVTIYVSEVMRRLKQGEITESPPFPKRFIHGKKDIVPSKMLKEAESEATMDSRKITLEDTCTQTEPFRLDIDMKGFFKDNLSQTKDFPKEEPHMFSKKPNRFFRIPCCNLEEKTSQVTSFKISPFKVQAEPVAKQIAKMTIAQSIQDVEDEMSIKDMENLTAKYAERLATLQRTMTFRYMQEKYRNEAYSTEHEVIRMETLREVSSEESIGAVWFATSHIYNIRSKVLDSLRTEGFMVNEDLFGIQTVLASELSMSVRTRMSRINDSKRLLDEMINHALLDLELDYFRSNMVDAKYLLPTSTHIKNLRDLIEIRDDTKALILKMKDKLFALGYRYNEHGHLVKNSSKDWSSSVEELDAFLEAVRVSVDADGVPKYLVDLKGRPLPINQKWMRYLYAATKGVFDPTQRFDIILPEGSLSNFSNITEELEHEEGRGSVQEENTQGNEFEYEDEDFEGYSYEFEGSDLENFLEGGDEVDGDDDAGLIVFRRGTDENDVDFSLL